LRRQASPPGPRTPPGWRHALRGALLTGALAYAAGLLAWFVLSLLLRDQWRWLFAINAMAPYLFLPLPLALAIGMVTRRLPLLALCLAGTAIWVGLYGPLFMPRLQAAPSGGQALRVMTTNVLGWNQQVEGVVAALRASGADIIAIQELNLLQAAAIRTELAAEYPYQILDPQNGVSGSGLISRYPFTPTGETLSGGFRGTTHIVRVDVNGAVITFVRFHLLSGIGLVAERQAAAESLAAFAAAQPGPVIAAGDLNATPLNEAHRTVARVLTDAWEAQGQGFGHTFPGALSPGSSRPVLAGVAVPMWLVRIDYIFYSGHFRAVNAAFGPWDAVSDHRPVVADLVLQP